MRNPAKHSQSLRREVGVPGAVLLGLGSIVGTGVFVSIGIAAGVAGPAVILAIVLAALVAMCNAFSSAQLAAAHPVSGGTYEYGYEHLSPAAGFTAGWMFLCAKTASAATAALGFAGYLCNAAEWSADRIGPVAGVTAVAVTFVVATGIRRSNQTNAVIVGLTLLSLAAFVVSGTGEALRNAGDHLAPFIPDDGEPLRAVLYGTALMFVAFTGYGRIATLGEEVVHPKRTIPRAIVATLLISTALYVLVGGVAVAAVGAPALASFTGGTAAPLEVVARTFDVPGVSLLVALGAMTAMLGVLLNLVLGLSRVMLAMGRRGDMPSAVARLDAGGTTPTVAVWVIGGAVTGFALAGTIETAWSFSAFTVLLYYGLTNLAALRLKKSDRIFPRLFAWAGLASCFGLAFWVEPSVWISGLALLVAGLVWHAFMRSRRSRPT